MDKSELEEHECTNRWRLAGNYGDVSRAIALLVRKRFDGFDMMSFDRLVPMPEVLKTLHTGYQVIGEIPAVFWVEEERPDGLRRPRVLTESEGKRYAALCAEIGLESGELNATVWAKENWGTATDAWPGQVGVFRCEEYSEVDFNTYSRPPKPVFEALRTRFPDLYIEGYYSGVVGTGVLGRQQEKTGEQPVAPVAELSP